MPKKEGLERDHTTIKQSKEQSTIAMTMTTETEFTPSVAVESETQKTPPSSDQPKQYRMVALDLDGTLLNSNHKLSEVTKACLRRLDQQGFTVAIATGRAISTVYATVQSLNLPHPIPVVCSNGAEGVMCSVTSDSGEGYKVEKKPLFSTPVPMVVAQRTIDLAIEKGCASQYYIGEEIFASPKEPYQFEFCQAYIDLTGSKTQFVTDSFKAATTKGPPSKQLVYCKVEDQANMISAYETELAKEPFLINGKRAHIVRGQPGWFLEVMHPEVCKGNGLKKMCAQLNIPLEQCLAFGDGDNDKEFLQLAGKGFAMKNAGDDVKQCADEVLKFTNDEDGVAKTLTTMEEEGCLVFAA